MGAKARSLRLHDVLLPPPLHFSFVQKLQGNKVFVQKLNFEFTLMMITPENFKNNHK